MFYSDTILKGFGVAPGIATPILNFGNFIATFGGLALLARFGRRTLMVWGTLAMVIILIAAGLLSLFNIKIPVIITLVMFIFAFEFTSGPITWLYMSEIMQDKATSFASGLNWSMNCIISGSVPYLVRTLTSNGRENQNVGYIFIACGGFTAVGFIFIYVYMKETKGKKKQDIEWMYSSNKQYAGKNAEKKLFFGEGDVNDSE
jgi:MFS family permease